MEWLVLFFANLGLGFGTTAVFIATLFLSVGVTLLLLPKPLVKGKLESKSRYIIGAISVVIAVAVMGVVYMSTGGFPAVNLIFAEQATYKNNNCTQTENEKTVVRVYEKGEICYVW